MVGGVRSGVLVYVLVASVCSISESSPKTDKCMYTIDLSLCRPKENQPPPKTRQPQCDHYEVCKKNFKISFVNLEPYTSELVTDIVRGCCGMCANISQVDVLTTLGEIPPVENRCVYHDFMELLGGGGNRFPIFIPLIRYLLFFITILRYSTLLLHPPPTSFKRAMQRFLREKIARFLVISYMIF